jgi:hypothetical protein
MGDKTLTFTFIGVDLSVQRTLEAIRNEFDKTGGSADTFNKNLISFSDSSETSSAKLETLRQDLDGLGTDAETAGGHLDNLGTSVDNVGNGSGGSGGGLAGLASSLANFGSSAKSAADPMGALGTAFNLLKLPLAVSGLNLVTGSLSALSMGAIEVVGALQPLVGLLPVAATTASAFGEALVVTKLAFSGVGTALKDSVVGGAAYDKAMAKLTESQKTFVLGMQPLMLQLHALKEVAASNMLPGVLEGFQKAQPLINMFTPAVASMASVLGGLATQAGVLAGSALFRSEFGTITSANSQIIQNFGTGLLSLVQVLASLMAAAAPLATTLSGLFAAWAAGLVQTTNAAAASGTLAKFFASTEVVVRSLASTISEFFHALGPIFAAGAAAGSGFLDMLNRGATAFNTWTHSAAGIEAIRHGFETAQPVLQALGRLVEAVAVGFVHMGAAMGGGTALAATIDTISTKLVPAFDAFAKVIGTSLLNNLVTIASNLLRIFTVIGTGSGSIQAITGFFATLTGVLATLVEHVPGLGTFVTVITAIALLGRATGITDLATSLIRLGASLLLTTALNANTAALTGMGVAAEGSRLKIIAMTVANVAMAGASRVGAAAMAALTAVMEVNPFVLAATAIAALAVGFTVLY